MSAKIDVTYEPFDQDVRLPPPPWSPDDPAVQAWEEAHGHDVRSKCYVEFGCQVIEPQYQRRVLALELQIQKLRAALEEIASMATEPVKPDGSTCIEVARLALTQEPHEAG